MQIIYFQQGYSLRKYTTVKLKGTTGKVPRTDRWSLPLLGEYSKILENVN